jgi:NTE family protein
VAFERERLQRTEAWTGWALDAQSIIDVFRLWSGAERMTPEEARKIGAKALAANCVEEESYLELYSDRLDGRRWGSGDVRIATVNCGTGERTFWTRDSDVPLRRAVAASCAIPAFFPPVTIHGERYMDGGVWSGTNADVLLDAGVDAALIIAPMTAETFLADATRRALDREVALLTDSGIDVEAIAPEVGALGTQLMDPAAVEPALERGIADGEEAGEAVRRLMK